MEIYVTNDNQLVLPLRDLETVRGTVRLSSCFFAGWGSIHTQDGNSLVSKLNTSFAKFKRFKVVPFARSSDRGPPDPRQYQST